MKKLILVFFAAIAMLPFLACSGKSNSGDGMPSIGVTIYKFDDTFMSYTRNAIQLNAAGKAALVLVDSENDQSRQNDQVDAFLSRKVDSLAINPVDRTAVASIIEKARSRNTPVVFFNREPLPEDMASWDKIYYVGAKAEQSGIMQGEIAYDYWMANQKSVDKNGDGVLQYIMLMGEPGHQDTEQRTYYAIQYLKEKGVPVQCLAEDTAMWDKPRAKEKMQGFLEQYGDRIEMVFCNNDDMALGVIEALKGAGYFQDGKFMPVLGVDGTAPALQALEEGTLLGTVLNDADNQGKATFDIAFALATGANPDSAGWTITDDKYIWVPYRKVTLDNYRQYKK